MTQTDFQPITRAAASLWAKSPRDGGATVPVLNHLLDVAACAAEILQLEPPQTRTQMAADLGLSEAEGLPWVLALIALHDLGKASPAFQMIWPEGKEGVDSALPFTPMQGDPEPHGLVSQATLPPLLVQRLGWPTSLAAEVADAVGCHHGFRASPERLKLSADQLGADAWKKVRLKLLSLVAEAVGANSQAVPTATRLSPEGFMRLAGLTSFADWLGSSFQAPTQTDYSAYADPAAYFERARQKARQTLEQAHWPEFASLHGVVPTMGEVFGYLSSPQPFVPRPLQEVVAGELDGVSAPTLCIVEAPMGEGKTEAAFYAYLQLQAQLQHRGLYVALPTQATGNAMYTRLAEFLARQGRQRPPSLQLAHGGTLLSEEYQARLEATRKAHVSPTSNLPSGAGESVRAEEWFSQRKRALLDEYGVGTVDQALLGVLGVSHQFVRLWGLGNRVVVLDEVHAYDTYTSAIIATLVGWLRALGSSVILMSATLPASSRQQLLEAWGAEDAPAADYPRVTVAEAGKAAQAVTVPTGEASRAPQKVAVQALGAGAGEVAAKAAELVEGGGCVAVIVNTVQRAQAVQQAIVAELRARKLVAQTCTGKPPEAERDWPKVGVLLYHARYPAEERLYREERVLKYLGKGEGSTRPKRFILIATQVAEQSLDFDADAMITDLAPIDLVLQRAGRLHRHARNAGQRHGHDTAKLYVAGLQHWPAEALKQEYWGKIYAPALLYRSWATLRERLSSGFTLPDDLDGLVQRVYAPQFASDELGKAEQEALHTAERELEGQREKESYLGGTAHIGHPVHFWGTRIQNIRGRGAENREALDDDPEFLGTRLGSESIRVVPVQKVGGVWQVMPKPRPLQSKEEREDKEGVKPQFATLEKGQTENATVIYRRSLNVSSGDIVRLAARVWADGAGQPLGSAGGKVGWAAHPLLRDAVPVWFDSETRRARISDTLTLELHPELGLVYHRTQPEES